MKIQNRDVGIKLPPDEMESGSARLAALIEKFTGQDGTHSTTLSPLVLYRSSFPSEPIPTIYEPSLCIVAQGRKQIMNWGKTFYYSPNEYLLVSVDLPRTGQVVEATPSKPYLALQLKFDHAQINETLLSNFPALEGDGSEKQPSALDVNPLPAELLEAVIRLVQLLENPRDAAVLFPLIRSEILFRLLTGAQGQFLRQIGRSSSHTHRIARAIDWLKRNYTESLRIAEIAHIAHMSPSGFHHHFKAVTAMTPLQFQKQLRLQEARRLLLSEDIDAATACYRVGYESPSQFSREYSRLFGDPPLRDIAKVKGSFAPH
jgi:AraC-like DNA-binding protein